MVALRAGLDGVTCNAICPGWVLTPLLEPQIAARAAAAGQRLEDAQREILAEKQPSGEFATSEQIGQFADFLCSDGASQITGAALNIDGGGSYQSNPLTLVHHRLSNANYNVEHQGPELPMSDTQILRKPGWMPSAPEN